MAKLNAVAQLAWSTLIAKYPTWQAHFETRGNGDLELAVPAPAGSKAGHLIVFTAAGKDLWVRFSPPCMCYPLDDEDEMLSVLEGPLSERECFVTFWRDGEWTGTTLIESRADPTLEAAELAEVVSWSGANDRTARSDE